MTNTDLLKKLKDLGKTTPDQKFLKDNRELLLSQISNSGAEKIGTWKSFVITFNNLAKVSSRPAFAIGMFFFALVGTALFSQKVLENSKPNDSFYIARVISERMKVNTTFDSLEREKLASRYALKRAEDIAVILSDEEFNKEENRDQVAKLSDDFKTEVSKVKTSLSRLPLDAKKPAANDMATEDEVVIADSSKDNSGLEIYTPEIAQFSETILPEEELATSSEEVIVEDVDVVDPVSKIDELNDLFDQKDYVKAQEKLNEIKESIE